MSLEPAAPKKDESAADGEKFNLLQVLRGLAALSVVCFHAYTWDTVVLDPVFHWGDSILTLGWAGLDCFFCLSGFIITWIHVQDIGRPERGRIFILKRFVRIYPPLFVLIVLKCVLLAVLYHTHNFEASSNTIGRAFRAFFVLPAMNDSPLIMPEWTLTYEVLFYGLFCLMILMGKRFIPVALVVWVSGIVLYNLVGSGLPDSGATSFVFNPYNIEFLGGVLAAYVARRQVSVFPLILLFALLCGLLSAGISFQWIHLQHTLQRIGADYLVQKVLLAGIFSLVIVMLVKLEMHRKIRVSGFFVFLGTASYSIYLVHQEAIAHMDSFGVGIGKFGQLPWLHTFLLILAALTSGIVYYFLIEKPLLKRCRQWIRSNA